MVDPRTGEVLAGQLIYRTARRARKGQFFMIDYDTDAMRELNSKRLPGTVLNALLYLFAHVERGNVLDIGIAQLAEACSMTEAQASLALKRLRQEKVITAYKHNRIRMHMLNPAFGWNGPANEMLDGLKAWEARVLAEQDKGSKQLRLIESELPA